MQVTWRFQIRSNLYRTVLQELNLIFNFNEYFNYCEFDWLYSGMACSTNNFFFQRDVRVEIRIQSQGQN